MIAAGETSWQRVVESLTSPWPDGPAVHYQKHMTHHLIPELPRDWIASLRNVLLIRDPAEVVASYVRSRANVVAEDIGLVQQTELYDLLGGDVPVVDAPTSCSDPSRICGSSATTQACRSMRGDAARGRPGRATRTGCGRRTGTTRCGRRPASSRTARVPSSLTGAALEAAERSRPALRAAARALGSGCDEERGDETAHVVGCVPSSAAVALYSLRESPEMIADSA